MFTAHIGTAMLAVSWLLASAFPSFLSKFEGLLSVFNSAQTHEMLESSAAG